MGKTVGKSKFSEWKGLDRISEAVHSMNCIWREISKDDFGIDGEIEFVREKSDGSGFETTGGLVKVQARSGSSYIVRDAEATFSVRVEADELRVWQQMNVPVILIIYHPKQDCLFWKDIQGYLRNTPDVFKPPIQVQFDKTADLFGEAAKADVGELAGATEARISFSEQEKLFSNLLPARTIPQWLWSASCSLEVSDVHEATRGEGASFLLHEKRLFTFQDLRAESHPFQQIIDPGDIEAHSVDEWLGDDELERLYVRALNYTLKDHLGRRGVRFQRELGRYFFSIDPSERERKEQWYSVRTKRSSFRTVAQYYEYGKTRFFRHDAAHLDFLHVREQWYLRLVPAYVFTFDARQLWRSSKAHEYAIRKKAQESNQHVLNHVLFWSSFLAGSRSQDHIEIGRDVAGRPLVVLDREPATVLTDFAVVHDPAYFEADEPTLQAPLEFEGLNDAFEELVAGESLDDDD